MVAGTIERDSSIRRFRRSGFGPKFLLTAKDEGTGNDPRDQLSLPQALVSIERDFVRVIPSFTVRTAVGERKKKRDF